MYSMALFAISEVLSSTISGARPTGIWGCKLQLPGFAHASIQYLKQSL